MGAAAGGEAFLRGEGISLRFGGITALREVAFGRNHHMIEHADATQLTHLAKTRGQLHVLA